jgi:putative transposase
MAIPVRNSREDAVRNIARTFFATSKTIQGRHLLQSQNLAALLIDVLRQNALANKFIVHDFVIMPDHIHLLLTVDSMMTIEKAMQYVKGGFSHRAKKELGYQGEIWQKGFSEVRIKDRPNFLKHRKYIHQNPVKAGLVDIPENFPYGSAYLKKQKQASG